MQKFKKNVKAEAGRGNTPRFFVGCIGSLKKESGRGAERKVGGARWARREEGFYRCVAGWQGEEARMKKKLKKIAKNVAVEA